MLVYQEEYGSDADGRRGIIQICAELEPSDADEVREQIKAQFDFSVTDYVIYMYDEHGMDHQFHVDIHDYFTYDEIKEL